MLIPATASQEGQRLSSNDLRMRSLQQKPRTAFNVNLLRDGQGIHSLRATGGPPADHPLASLGPEALQQRAEERREQQNSLFKLPTGGRGLLHELSGHVRSATALMGGLVDEVIEGTGGYCRGGRFVCGKRTIRRVYWWLRAVNCAVKVGLAWSNSVARLIRWASGCLG